MKKSPKRQILVMLHYISNAVNLSTKRILDLLCPASCVFCKTQIESEEKLSLDSPLLCEKCKTAFVTPEGHFCRRCGGKRHFEESLDMIEAANIALDIARLDESSEMDAPKIAFACAQCRRTKFSFSHCITLGEYEKELKEAVLRSKNEKSGANIISATRLLFETREDLLKNQRFDLIVPVPMYYLRKFRRGVNAAEYMAEELSRLLKIPYSNCLVRRVRPTHKQTSIPPLERAKNVNGVFALSRFAANPKGMRILLVDDILTTGATSNEISRLLLSAGAASVALAVIARAEGKTLAGTKIKYLVDDI